MLTSQAGVLAAVDHINCLSVELVPDAAAYQAVSGV